MATEVTDRTAVRPEDEGRWVAASQGGDRSAFARLVEAYWGRLYRWLFQLTHDRHAAEDLAQEAFLKAWANLARFRPGTNFRAWLFRIAHNALVNTRRGPHARRAVMPDDVPGDGPGPQDVALSREELARVGKAVEGLPTDWRAALLLRVEEGLSFRQIAAVTDTTEETARWRVFKARQRLMAWLDRGDEG
ncbi:MAG: RNA polymerase sigma factor [Gemmataceae bacterium]